MLDLVRLPGFGHRKPSQLVRRAEGSASLWLAPCDPPKVLLLDEPLGALDLKLRQQMQVELKPIQQQVGITFVFVTHDQEEALTMSDRIAVFNDGKWSSWARRLRFMNILPRPLWLALSVRRIWWMAIWRVGSLATRSASPSGPRDPSCAEGYGSPWQDMLSADGRVRDVIYLGLYTRYLVELQAEATWWS